MPWAVEERGDKEGGGSKYFVMQSFVVRHRTGDASLNVFPIYFHANFEFPL